MNIKLQGLIRFLHDKDNNPIEIYSELVAIYGKQEISIHLMIHVSKQEMTTMYMLKC